MRSSIDARARAACSLALSIILSFTLLPASALAFMGEGLAFADPIEEGAVLPEEGAPSEEGPSPSEGGPSQEGIEPEAPSVVSASMSSRTVSLPADSLASFSYANIAAAEVPLGREADSIEALHAAYVVDGCAYAFDEQSASFTLLNAVNASLEEDGSFVVPANLSIDGKVHPVASIAPGALSGSPVRSLVLPRTVERLDVESFSGCEALDAIVISPHSHSFFSFDGCLYDGPSSSLLLVPEGRAGAVRIAPSAKSLSFAAFSHCASEKAIADAGSAAVLSLGDVTMTNASGRAVELLFEEGIESDPEEEPSSLPWEELDRRVVEVELDGCDGKTGFVEDAATEDHGTGADIAMFNDVVELSSPTPDSAISLLAAPSAVASSETATSGALPCWWYTDDTKTIKSEITAEAVKAGRGDAERAGWSFDVVSGTLKIWSAHGVSVKGLFARNQHDWAIDDYWIKVGVEQVRAVDTTELSGADNMSGWFKLMTSLVNIENVRIPDGSKGGVVPNDLGALFYKCAFRDVPPTLYIPEGVRSLWTMFDSCENLVGVYDEFAIPRSCVETSGMFEFCTKLQSVPSKFFSKKVPLPGETDDEITRVNPYRTFWGCKSLSALNDGFVIPSTVSNVSEIFADCPDLTYLPASLDLRNVEHDIYRSSETTYGACSSFGRDMYEEDPSQNGTYVPLKEKTTTYVPLGPGESEMDALARLLPKGAKLRNGTLTSDPKAYWSDNFNRDLTVVGNVVELKIRRVGETGMDSWKTWLTMFAPEGKIKDPGAPYGYGFNFAGWYGAIDQLGNVRAGSQCSADPDGKFTVLGNAIYAEYVATSGALPLGSENGQNIENDNATIAGWNFDAASGLLRIWSEPGYTVGALFAKFPGDSGSEPLHWASVLANVTKVDTRHLSGALDMNGWFHRAAGLVDISDVRIPDGSAGGKVPSQMRFTFDRTAIKEIPPTFVIPEGVQSLHCLFSLCKELSSIYDGFALPRSCTYTGGMFEWCSSLAAVPGAFLSKKEPLPSESATNKTPDINMFRTFWDCDGITNLNEGFDLPSTVACGYQMFLSCNSLSYLPSSLDLSRSEHEGDETMDKGAGVWGMFAETDIDGQNPAVFATTVPTYVTLAEGETADEAFARLLPKNAVLRNGEPTTDARAYWRSWYNRSLMLSEALPLRSDDGSTNVANDDATIAGWSFDEAAGVLKVWSKEGVTVGALFAGANHSDEEFWKKVPAEAVVSVDTMDLAGAHNMERWFSDLPNLTDITKLRIPDGSKNGAVPHSVHRLLQSAGITEVPASLTIPEGVANASLLFEMCDSLNIVSGNFVLPRSCTDATAMFEWCSSLRNVPGSIFSKKEPLTGESSGSATPGIALYRMFWRCTSLAALEEGFAIPSTATNVNQMFLDCANLRYLPSTFDMRPLFHKAGATAGEAYSMFGAAASDNSASHPSTEPLSEETSTYVALAPGETIDQAYARLLPKEAMSQAGGATDGASYWLDWYNRKLVTEGVTLEFKVRQKDCSQSWRTWLKLFAPSGDVLAPGAPHGWSYDFAGWFSELDADGNTVPASLCPVREDATVSVPATGVVYGEYVVTSGALPLRSDDDKVNIENSDQAKAGWLFDPEKSTLSVWSAPGNTIGDLEFNVKHTEGNYWSPLVSKVHAADTSDVSGATNMVYWFAEMRALTDIGEVIVPNGVHGGRVPSSLKGMFSRSGIVDVPITFSLPEGVRNCHTMFDQCEQLVSVHENFILPRTTTDVSGMFEFCSRLQVIPAKLFSNKVPLIGETSSNKTPSISMYRAFWECESITELPGQFALPSTSKGLGQMFKGARNLVRLPASLDMRSFSHGASSLDLKTAFADTLEEEVEGELNIQGTKPFDDELVTYYSVGWGETEAEAAARLLPQDAVLADGTPTTSAVDYWKSWYNRKLVPLKEVESQALFYAQKTDGGTGWTLLGGAPVMADTDGKVARPKSDDEMKVPGYVFVGWFTSPEGGTEVDFDEDGRISIRGIKSYYACYTAVIRVDVPDSVNDEVSLDLTLIPGDQVRVQEVTQKDFNLRSFTPQTTKISVETQFTKGDDGALPADELFLDGTKVRARLVMSMDGGTEVTMGLGDDKLSELLRLEAAANPSNPTVEHGVMTIDVGNTKLNAVAKAYGAVSQVKWSVEIIYETKYHDLLFD